MLDMLPNSENIGSEDELYVSEVVEWLRQLGLKVSLHGRAKKSPRYFDIDLLAEGHSINIISAIQGLNRNGDFRETSADGKTYSIIWLFGRRAYIDRIIDEAFIINIGETIIDLNFQNTDVDRNDVSLKVEKTPLVWIYTPLEELKKELETIIIIRELRGCQIRP